MSNVEEMTQEEWRARTDAALDWVRRSIVATGGQGSSHSWHPLLGWARAYPETTGYLIETLLVFADLKQDESLRHLAFGCGEWLESIQLPSGAYAGLLAGNKQPSVFNTSQILFGLKQYAKVIRQDEHDEQDGEGLRFFRKKNPVHPVHPVKKYNTCTSIDRATSWLLSNLEPDGAWRNHAFVPGFVPSYYTRAVWAVLQAIDLTQSPEIEDLMRRSLGFYAQRFLPNGAVKDAGFRLGEEAFTHTLAYTLEGFWESALLLREWEILEKVIGSLERLLAERAREKGRTAGRYDEQWRGDYSFLCITGNCQLSILCHKVWTRTGEPKFEEAAHSFLAEIIGFQKLGANKNSFGALPGSAPFWGAYLPFRYPNWAVKFFLDAMAGVVEG